MRHFCISTTFVVKVILSYKRQKKKQNKKYTTIFTDIPNTIHVHTEQKKIYHPRNNFHYIFFIPITLSLHVYLSLLYYTLLFPLSNSTRLLFFIFIVQCYVFINIFKFNAIKMELVNYLRRCPLV